MRQDPKGFGAGSMDLFEYVGNGPTNEVDPNGMETDQEALQQASENYQSTSQGMGQQGNEDNPNGEQNSDGSMNLYAYAGNGPADAANANEATATTPGPDPFPQFSRIRQLIATVSRLDVQIDQLNGRLTSLHDKIRSAAANIVHFVLELRDVEEDLNNATNWGVADFLMFVEGEIQADLAAAQKQEDQLVDQELDVIRQKGPVVDKRNAKLQELRSAINNTVLLPSAKAYYNKIANDLALPN